MPNRNEGAIRFKDKLSHRPVICTGGRSYFVIRGDGKIYRCLYNPEVIGNIANGLPQLDGQEMVCRWKNSHDKLVDSCHPSGDLMFATFWEKDEEGSVIRHQAPWAGSVWQEPDVPGFKGDGDAVSPEESDNFMSTAETRKAFFQVLPVNSKCNFACTYCCNFYYESEDGSVIGRPKDHGADIPMEIWRSFLDKASKKLDFAHFGFLGGEPTLYKHIVDLTLAICNEHGWEVGICSNMSRTDVFRKIIDGLSDDAKKFFRVSASLHPFSKNFRWETYWESAKILVDAGIKVRATMVSWPEQTYLYDDLNRQLGEIGVHLHLKGIGGYDVPEEDWRYISSRGGTMETPDYLKEIGWF